MFEILQNFNLFPYNHFWRISKQPNHSNKCSIIVSILIILAIGAVFIQRLVQVFKMQTMHATTQTTINQSPPLTTISTFQNNTQNQPFMFAIDYLSGHPGLILNSSSLNIKVYTSILEGPTVRNRTMTNHTINMEQCTPQHFSMFKDINIKFSKWSASNWLCLPLNQLFTIQGSYGFDNKFTRISLLFNCSGPCMTTFTGMNLKLYTLSAVVNPTNSTTPQQHFLQQMTVPIYKDEHQQYSYSLAQNQIQQDNSLFPWSTVSHHHSLQTDQIRQVQHNITVNQSSTLVYFHRSYKTISYSSSYLKFLDALSFVGGVFQAIIGIFVFMVIFGRFFFQSKFGKKYFHSEILQHFSFTDFVKQLVYKILAFFNCPPDWQQAHQRQKMQQTVNNMLDIVYLQKRIDILERALPILLEQHQIKGLYLLHSKTREEADNMYQEHQLRDRLITYLNDQKQIQRELEQRKEYKQMKKRQNMMRKLSSESPERSSPDRMKKMEKKDSSQKEQKNKLIMHTEKMQREEIFQYDQTLNSVKRHSSYHKNEHIQLSDIIIKAQQKNGEKEKQEQSQNAQSIQIQSEKAEEEDAEQRQSFYLEMLRNTVKELGITNFNPISDQQMKQSLGPDLLKLMLQAQKQEGDERSKKIYNSIEEWIKQLLKKIAKHRQFQLKKQKVMKLTISEVQFE